jgi:hypothetical protein
MKTNHTYRRVSRDTIRLAFQIPGPYNREPFKIWRIRPEQGKNLFHLEGFFLDNSKCKTRVAVTHARPGDVLMITHLTKDGEIPPPIGFRVEANGPPTPITDLSPFAQNQVVSHGPTIDFDGHRFLHFKEEDVCVFVTAKHPRWLQEHVDSTLRSWRTEAPDLYVRVAPSHWLGKKPWLLASLDPRKALEDHPQNLSHDLRRFCIRRLIPNRNRTLNPSLPSALKSSEHYQNASYLLKHHLPELDDEQLRICAFKNPNAALARYSQVPDLRRRALLLSCAFRHAWPNSVLMQDPEFHQDVIDSLTCFTEEWTISHPEGLVSVLRLISARIPFHPTPDELIRMMERMDPHAQQCVADFVSSRI